ncbi:MAG: hypothetical protein DMF84_29980 [Acidobacteria bacterium]|nr:MAG: hypothetical protein DMF84_29980 [Acidobacteriota bacterium]
MVNTCVAAILAAAMFAAPFASPPEDARSTELVKQLTQLLDQKKLDSLATGDSKNLGTYVAALYFPGTQLLVVTGKYAAPPLLNEKIAKKDYRDVYIDLNSASVAGSKVFFMDLNADGLVAKPGENLGTDSIEQAGKTITFDGDWKKGKMSEAEYLKAFSDADAAYAHALELLIAQLKTLGTQ